MSITVLGLSPCFARPETIVYEVKENFGHVRRLRQAWMSVVSDKTTSGGIGTSSSCKNFHVSVRENAPHLDGG
jgi:hypothetical protein